MKNEDFVKLNLGCGNDIQKGYINTDIANNKGIDRVFDFNKFPFPFKENTFEEIRIWNSIHCVGNLIKFMEEIYRISKNKAIIKIQTHFFLSPDCANDPYYKTRIGFNTFNLFEDKNKQQGISSDTTAHFKILKKKWIFSTNKYLKWLSFIPNISPKIYVRFFYFYFPSNNLYFELKVMK